jgi:hypothetical protein
VVEDDEIELICSAKGCRAPAVHQLRWNNPKIHAAAARKTWLACDDHRAKLGDFLDARRFLREVLPLSPPRPGDSPGGPGAAADGADAMTP